MKVIINGIEYTEVTELKLSEECSKLYSKGLSIRHSINSLGGIPSYIKLSIYSMDLINWDLYLHGLWFPIDPNEITIIYE